MAVLTEAQMKGLIAQYWSGKDALMALYISHYESGWDTNAHADDSDDDSYGLFQINMKGDLGVRRRAKYGITNQMLYSSALNTNIAHRVWAENGMKFSGSAGWSTSAARAEVAIAAGGTGPTGSGTSGDDSFDDLTPAQQAAYYSGVEKLKAAGLLEVSGSGSTAGQYNIQDLIALAPSLTVGQAGLTQAEVDAIKLGAQYQGGGLAAIDEEFSDIFETAFESDWMAGLGKFFGILTNPEFWKRVGLGVLGAAVILIGIILWNQEAITEAMP